MARSMAPLSNPAATSFAGRLTARTVARGASRRSLLQYRWQNTTSPTFDNARLTVCRLVAASKVGAATMSEPTRPSTKRADSTNDSA